LKKNKNIAAVLMLSSITFNVSAQNNDIFYGGSGDGHALNNYAQISIATMFKGDVGDGHTVANYAQYHSSTLFAGGTGDGHAVYNYAQIFITAMFKGDVGDGHSVAYYGQNYSDFRTGGAGDGWASNMLPMMPLPLTLLSFTGKEMNGKHLLEWETAQETNIRYFELEHTVHTSNSFQKIGKITAKGNKGTSQVYNFQNDYPAVGNNFYRLKLTDHDGKFSYSNIVLLKLFKNKSSILLYPNPTASALNIVLGSNPDNSAIRLEVYSISGHLMSSHDLQHKDSKITIDTHRLPAGTYTIRILNNGETDVLKFVKAN